MSILFKYTEKKPCQQQFSGKKVLPLCHADLIMNTIYRFSKYSKYFIWAGILVLVIALGLIVSFILKEDVTFRIFSSFLCIASAFCSLYFILTSWIEVDDAAGTLTFHASGKVVIDITKIDRIARHVDSRERVRYLTVHEVGVKYSDIVINYKDEEAFMAHLLRINPDITVVTYSV